MWPHFLLRQVLLLLHLLLPWVNTRRNLLPARTHRLELAGFTLHLPLHNTPRVLHSLGHTVRAAQVCLHLLAQQALVIVGGVR